MNDLKKLLENAGIMAEVDSSYVKGNLGQQYQENFSELLNDFSDRFTFKVTESESIQVLYQGHVAAEFASFDELVDQALGGSSY
jgi:hypothetical protein